MTWAQPEILTALFAVVTYFICGIPFGLIIGKSSGHVDIRKAGSGNIGTTNALRVAGPKVAALTLLLDCLKGAACVIMFRAVMTHFCFAGISSYVEPGSPFDWTVGIICLVGIWGHVFSPYLHFKGGKGIAVGLGVILAWYWPIGLTLLGFFIVGVAVTRYVSFGSLLAAIGLPIATVAVFPACSYGLKGCMTLIGVTVIWAHRVNIRKLVQGNESKLSFHKRVTEPDDDK